MIDSKGSYPTDGNKDRVVKARSISQSKFGGISAARFFTPRVHHIVANLRGYQHILKVAVLNTIKQHCVDRILMPMAARLYLVGGANCLKQNKLFSEITFRIFEKPTSYRTAAGLDAI